MRNPNIHKLNKTFESRVRLGIMSVLMTNEEVDFNTLKDLLNVSDGNLASHAAVLEREGYMHVKKAFVGKKTSTTYSATRAGKKAFEEHLGAMERLIKGLE